MLIKLAILFKLLFKSFLPFQTIKRLSFILSPELSRFHKLSCDICFDLLRFFHQHFFHFHKFWNRFIRSSIGFKIKMDYYFESVSIYGIKNAICLLSAEFFLQSFESISRRVSLLICVSHFRDIVARNFLLAKFFLHPNVLNPSFCCRYFSFGKQAELDRSCLLIELGS